MASIRVVGGWPHAGMLVRLLRVIDAPWQAGPRGLEERGTGALCTARFGPRDPALTERIRAGEDPRAPSILATDWPEIEGHHSVLEVRSGATEVLGAARDVLRCGASMVNAGGVAVLVSPSGVAHAGTRWIELAEALDPADPLPVLVQAFARWPVRLGAGFGTAGLGALGLRDLSLPDLADETLAHAVCEQVVARQVAGADPVGPVRALERSVVISRAGNGLRGAPG